jgi:hypothetical protein
MPYIVVESFKGGLDRRRSDLVSAPGMLIKAENVHVTRGGEIEKRKAFVAVDAGVDTEHNNPFEGTYGLESTGGGTTVFTTSYATTSWYNAGKWVRFLWWNTADNSSPTQGSNPGKIYVRFQYQNAIHEINTPNLSISSERIQIPSGSREIDISFSPPVSGSLVSFFTCPLLNGSNENLVVVASDGVTDSARCFDVGLSKLPKFGTLFLNYSQATITVNVDKYKAIVPPLPVWPKPPIYVGAPSVSLNSTYEVSFLSSLTAPPATPFYQATLIKENPEHYDICIFRPDSGATNSFVRLQSTTDVYQRKSLKDRIETTYTTIKVIEVDHPDGEELVGIVYSTVYGGKSFVLAKFANGDVLPFYDGKLVTAFTDGVYRAYYGGLYRFVDSIADLMRDSFKLAQDNYELDSSNNDQIRQYSVATTETPTGTSMTITGPSNVDFKLDAYIDSPCEFTIETIQEAAAPISAKTATSSFTVAAGTTGAASTGITLRRLDGYHVPGITGIFITADPDNPDPAEDIEITGLDRVDPDQVVWPYTGLTSGDAWDANQKLCYAISYIINTNTISSRISSSYSNYGGGWNKNDPATFGVSSTSKMGAQLNGRGVWFEFISNSNLQPPHGYMYELLNTSTVRVSPYDPTRFLARLTSSGYEGGGSGILLNGMRNAVDSIIANNVELLSDVDPATMFSTEPDKAQYFDTGPEQLAIDITDSINHGSVNHNYSATRDGARVTISAPVSGVAGNNKPVSIKTSGNVILSGKTGFSGGRDSIPGQPKIMRINFTGTPTVGNKCWVMITDPAKPQTPYKFGATRMAGKNGVFCFTYKGKEYIGVGSTMYFSSLNNPVKWDTYDTGSGFIDMSNNFGGRDDLTGAGVYQNNIAVFTERNCQLWFFDPDPNQNSQKQVLDNTGCLAPNSVVSVGATDLFYLSYNGVRSLQSRESTDAAYANDIGSPIDEIVISILASLTPEQRAAAKALIEPIDGRYWISIGPRLFVLSYFKGSNILAWSEYVIGFQVDEMVAFREKVYIRSGNKIYLYGGNGGSEYDSCPVVVELPYLDANKPGTFKSVNGVDITCQGTWKVFMGFDYTNANARDEIATFTQPSFALGKIPATGIGTHIGVRLTSDHPGYSRLANVLVHYDDLHSKHEAG